MKISSSEGSQGASEALQELMSGAFKYKLLWILITPASLLSLKTHFTFDLTILRLPPFLHWLLTLFLFQFLLFSSPVSLIIVFLLFLFVLILFYPFPLVFHFVILPLFFLFSAVFLFRIFFIHLILFLPLFMIFIFLVQPLLLLLFLLSGPGRHPCLTFRGRCWWHRRRFSPALSLFIYLSIAEKKNIILGTGLKAV